MTERNIGDVLCQPPFYRLRLVVVLVHPVAYLVADMVHGLFISDTGHVEMYILHDHADASLIFLVLLIFIT